MKAGSSGRLRPDWVETKYVWRRGRMRAGRAPHVARGSVLVVELLAEQLSSLVRSRARGALADIGCGRAPLYGTYAPMVDGSTLVDWPASFHQGSCVDVYANLDQGLPFREAVFDTIVLSDVLEHSVDGRALLQELARVARKDGLILGSVPFLYGLHEEPHDHVRYTRFALDHLFTTAGFAVETLHEYGGSMDVVVDLLAKHLGGLGPVGRRAAVVLQRVWLAVRAVPIFRETRLRLRAKFPLGYVFVARRIDGDAEPPTPASSEVASTMRDHEER